MLSDPIADLLTRIRNGAMAEHRFVSVRLSRHNIAILEVLLSHGFILDFKKEETKRSIKVFLRYTKGRKSLIQGLKRLSKPGVRKYVSSVKIPLIFKGLGIAILSTSKGVMDGKKARELNVGGELLCAVW